MCQKTDVLKTVIGEFDVAKHSPSQWITKFEQAVRCCTSGIPESEMGTMYMAYLPYFLAKNKSWFFQVRKADEIWPDFRKKFIAFFWSKYWKFAQKCLVMEPDDDQALLPYVKTMIENLKQLMPELTSKSIITLCILDLPDEIRPQLQEGVTESVEMFLSMVEAADIQLGRSKRSLESSDKNEDGHQDKRSKSTPAAGNQATNKVKTQSGSSDSSEKRILDTLAAFEERQIQHLDQELTKALSDDRLTLLLQKIISKKT